MSCGLRWYLIRQGPRDLFLRISKQSRTRRCPILVRVLRGQGEEFQSRARLRDSEAEETHG